jgi:polysaccharide pyruvyl transferase WcaK-like protein
MIRICIVGWYGTETMGDRAILDGIFQIFGELFGNYEVYLGSLCPILTERTLLLDGAIYTANAPGLKIAVFDARNKKELTGRVQECDYCIMGGGPIMDIDELSIIYFAFKTARRQGGKTILFGCGLGPLKKPANINITGKLFSFADIIIFRDAKAPKTALSLYGGRFSGKIYSLSDPALVSVGKYLEKNPEKPESGNTLAVNFRAFPPEYGEYPVTIKDFCSLVCRVSCVYEKVLLIPMHTFFIGGDDRYFLTKIVREANQNNVQVQQKPLNLYETYSVFRGAAACIGMRYHSVVFQTLLNGNNYILDYTDSRTGKIISFLEDIDKDGFYKDRYVNLKTSKTEFNSGKIIDALDRAPAFEYPKELFERSISSYRNTLNQIII